VSLCYLDASALVKLATPERETAALRAYLADFTARVTSRVALVEVPRALTRRSAETRAVVAAIAAAFEALEIVELDGAVVGTAAGLPPVGLRSLDAIHLASAMTLRDELSAFITYDVRLADAARLAGLTVTAPA
jgi:predicted nucleic acid-binding protein